MIKVKISDEIKKRHEHYFTQQILPNFNISKFGNDDLVLNNTRFFYWLILYVKKNAVKFAIGNFSILKEINIKIEKVLEHLVKEQETKDKIIKYLKDKDIFGYEKFVTKKFPKIKPANTHITIDNYEEHIKSADVEKYWSPYLLAIMSKIRVCPYCNRQYITPIITNSGRLRADLDHFLPKSKYPYFSMSLYNLIPCCKVCNSSLKMDKEFGFEDLHPYVESIDDYFKYKASIVDDKKINVIVEPEEFSKVDAFLEMFKIKELAGYHNNIGKEFLQKRLVYPDERLNDLLKSDFNLYKNKEHLKAAIIGYVPEKDEINNEVLAKMKRDLAKQFGFIEEDKGKVDNKIMIDNLKKLLSMGL